MPSFTEEQLVMMALGGTLVAAVAIAGCTVGCYACCYYSKSYRDFCSGCIKNIRKQKDDYQQLDPEETIVMQPLPSRSGDEQEQTPGDVERGAVPKPRRSIDNTKGKARAKQSSKEDDIQEADKRDDVEKGSRERLKRMVSMEKGDKEA